METKLEIAYDKYCDSHWTSPEDQEGASGLLAPQLWSLIPIEHSLETFKDKILTDDKFNSKWSNGCTKDLSYKERLRLANYDKEIYSSIDEWIEWWNKQPEKMYYAGIFYKNKEEQLNELGVPRRIIIE